MMLSFVVALASAQYTPQEAESLFVEANDAYYRSDWTEAKQRYEKLLAAGRGGPDVLFNLGTTQLAAGELGPATLTLERAARVSDADDIAANLALARKKQVDQVVGAETAVPFTQRLAEALDERPVAMSFLAVWWLGFLMLWLTFRRAEGHRLGLGLLSALLLVSGAALGAALGVQTYVRATVAEAIVMPEVAPVREFPGEGAKVAFEVHAGLKVRIMESSGRYRRIRLANALEGWTDQDAVEPL